MVATPPHTPANRHQPNPQCSHRDHTPEIPHPHPPARSPAVVQPHARHDAAEVLRLDVQRALRR